jgi:hypothetical protein
MEAEPHVKVAFIDHPDLKLIQAALTKLKSAVDSPLPFESATWKSPKSDEEQANLVREVTAWENNVSNAYGWSMAKKISSPESLLILLTTEVTKDYSNPDRMPTIPSLLGRVPDHLVRPFNQCIGLPPIDTELLLKQLLLAPRKDGARRVGEGKYVFVKGKKLDPPVMLREMHFVPVTKDNPLRYRALARELMEWTEGALRRFYGRSE